MFIFHLRPEPTRAAGRVDGPAGRLRPPRCRHALAGLLALLLGGCYVQRPLPHEPTYRPASWEPILGVVMKGGDEVLFDEPAILESGRVVGRVQGSRYVAELRDVERLLVGRKTLDKPKTAVFGAALLTAFALFFASIGLESKSVRR